MIKLTVLVKRNPESLGSRSSTSAGANTDG